MFPELQYGKFPYGAILGQGPWKKKTRAEVIASLLQPTRENDTYSETQMQETPHELCTKIRSNLLGVSPIRRQMLHLSGGAKGSI